MSIISEADIDMAVDHLENEIMSLLLVKRNEKLLFLLSTYFSVKNESCDCKHILYPYINNLDCLSLFHINIIYHLFYQKIHSSIRKKNVYQSSNFQQYTTKTNTSIFS